MKSVDKLLETRVRFLLAVTLVAGIAFGVILSDAMGWSK